MPRKPTTEVIEHRITLGTYERQLLSDTAGAYQFNKVSNPLVALISDNSAMGRLVVFGALIDLIAKTRQYFEDDEEVF